MSADLDYLGAPLPPGYRRWSCDVCGAGCNFEAMQQCAPTLREHPEVQCGFDRDQPESNAGPFAFVLAIGKKS
jgi:hypothetical protein